MRKVVLASRNADKVRELRQLFTGLDFEIVSSADYPGLPEVIEDGTTIVGNARRKAIITAAYTGEIAVADDTSLEVRELNGLPDIFAARFSGPEATYSSNAKLVLELMQGVPEDARQARFATACAWVDPQPKQKKHGVSAPAASRWLRNPWGQGSPFLGGRDDRDGQSEWDFWNTFVDRRQVWANYRQTMLSDLTSRGHNPEKLREVGEGLFTGCEDALMPGQKLDSRLQEEGMRLPDSTIWTVPGPEVQGEPSMPVIQIAPSGLPAGAPGLNQCQPFWLEITTSGKILGRITEQATGTAGFGYDPVFRPEGEKRTLAEMPATDKNAISHRGRAMRRLMDAVKKAYA